MLMSPNPHLIEQVNKLKMGKIEEIEGVTDQNELTVVLDVGDVGDVLGLGGGVVGELRLNFGGHGSQTTDNIRAVYKIRPS